MTVGFPSRVTRTRYPGDGIGFIETKVVTDKIVCCPQTCRFLSRFKSKLTSKVTFANWLMWSSDAARAFDNRDNRRREK